MQTKGKETENNQLKYRIYMDTTTTSGINTDSNECRLKARNQKITGLNPGYTWILLQLVVSILTAMNAD